MMHRVLLILNAIKISYLRKGLSATSAVNPMLGCTGRQIRLSRIRFAGSRDCQVSTLASGMAKLTLTVPLSSYQSKLGKELTGIDRLAVTCLPSVIEHFWAHGHPRMDMLKMVVWWLLTCIRYSMYPRVMERSTF